jgi:hypothetical protein
VIDERARKIFTLGFFWSAIVAGSIYLRVFNPLDTQRSVFFPQCPFHALTGLNCPGCGTTRALHQLVHGDVIGAFEFNPLTMSLLPVFGFFLAWYTVATLTGRTMPRISLPGPYLWIFLFLVFGFGIVRNTPLYPFHI